MKLISKPIEAVLLKNGALCAAGEDTSQIKPVCKLFTPWGGATWLISEMDPENPDILFGLCDLGLGFPEIGSVSLSELQELRGPAGLKVERDRFFEPSMTLIAYADAARAAGRCSQPSLRKNASARPRNWLN